MASNTGSDRDPPDFDSTWRKQGKLHTDETARRTLRHPDRKISETFLDFAAPILDLSTDAGEDHVRTALQIAFAVWNAVTFADVLNDPRHLDEIRRLTTEQPDIGLHLEELIARKRKFYADDERLIGHWELLRTEERDPHSLRRNSQ